MARKYPSETEIRRGLIDRAKAYCARTNTSLSSVGLKAVNDPAVLMRIRDGGNFTFDTYRRLMAWLDQHWPKRPKSGKAA